MTVGSLTSLGPVRAAELGVAVRNEAASRSKEPQVAMVEIVHPLDRQAKVWAKTEVLRSEPTTGRRRLDIRV